LRGNSNGGGVAAFQDMPGTLRVGALVTGANAALDRRCDQRIEMEFGANEIEHVQRPLLHDLTCRDDFARQCIRSLAQTWFQRAADQPRGVLQAFIFIQQLYRGIRDGTKLFGGDMTPISRSVIPPSAAATRTMVRTRASGASNDSRARIMNSMFDCAGP
jgi:hypothetical protein